MKVQITKHFDYLTPFKEAENDAELATIMRLKYPKACSSLEVDAEFFARMVEDVQKYEAWRVIGFDSFESFCKEKLGKTLDEVQAIVTGVRILQSRGVKKPSMGDVKKYYAENPPTIESHGGNRKSVKSSTNIVHDISKGGTDRIAAQIAKRRPDILKRMKAGEFRSVHAAAIEAGIVKPTASVPKTREGFVTYIKRTFSATDIRWIKDNL